MNGADRLCDVLLANGIDVCFANPGTSEMHFVAALDRKPAMRCVLGLFEGVVTGAADGYARMAERPAATLLHLGPGLANGLANIHNARRARTPMVNIVGDHATYHLQHDAPLTSDIESLARPMSHWVGRAVRAEDVRQTVEQAYLAACTTPGIATMILPADAAWNSIAPEEIVPVAMPAPRPAPPDRIAQAVTALRSGRRAALLIGGAANRGKALQMAGRITQALGVDLFAQRSGRNEGGAGRVAPKPIPYRVDSAIAALSHLDVVVLCGATAPVGFFAYPGKPSTLLPEECEVVTLASLGEDLEATLAHLADALGVRPDAPVATPSLTTPDLPMPTGRLTADAVSTVIARLLPENAIVCDESITSGGAFHALAPGARPHEVLPLMGGAIGIGTPLAAGAAIACPDRKVVGLQADGSAMYTIQGLWTQARENLDVVTVVYSNRAYAILQDEMKNVGVNSFGRNASRMLNLDEPALDWLSLARSFGVDAARAETAEELDKLFSGALSNRGPFLIEAVI
ncbi:acetolactate synthase large subunit [Rhodoligotrophos defluvii]|uniref:acetolactate synthase large subunit n=1 Tax=Rhodoligotrophos defluvii TaxID=2561934 RepID=UPI0010CA1EDB|nr:acetolactate synthase large subunit [Rhodoligotrophos defluvii]